MSAMAGASLRCKPTAASTLGLLVTLLICVIRLPSLCGVGTGAGMLQNRPPKRPRKPAGIFLRYIQQQKANIQKECPKLPNETGAEYRLRRDDFVSKYWHDLPKDMKLDMRKKFQEDYLQYKKDVVLYEQYKDMLAGGIRNRNRNREEEEVDMAKYYQVSKVVEVPMVEKMIRDHPHRPRRAVLDPYLFWMIDRKRELSEEAGATFMRSMWDVMDVSEQISQGAWENLSTADKFEYKMLTMEAYEEWQKNDLIWQLAQRMIPYSNKKGMLGYARPEEDEGSQKSMLEHAEPEEGSQKGMLEYAKPEEDEGSPNGMLEYRKAMLKHAEPEEDERTTHDDLLRKLKQHLSQEKE